MKTFLSLLLLTISSLSLQSCTKVDPDIQNSFDNIAESSNSAREKIVVISDLHLGNDLSYSETVKHMKRLEEFINEVRYSATVKELVIAGDMFDEWYIPTRQNTYGSGTQADFVRKTVTSYKSLFEQINGIIREKKIKVTYIPGNHDMGFLPENIDIAMPGVNQARDEGEKFGVGTYYPENYPQIAIEHGHRYDFFCAITPGANESEAPGATFAPGYFFARLAANSFVNPTTKEASTKVPEVKLNNPENEEQVSKFNYYRLWKSVLEETIYVSDNFDEPVINANIGNFNKTYSVNDILPKNNPIDGSIQMKLYNGIFTQSHWESRLKYNNVTVMTPINQAIAGSLLTEYIDNQSSVQYFNNPPRDTRIVIFGHTHKPMIKSFTNAANAECLYVNSGTWEDKKSRDKNAQIDQDAYKMNFVVISPVKSDVKKLYVGLYQYRYGKHFKNDSKILNL